MDAPNANFSKEQLLLQNCVPSSAAGLLQSTAGLDWPWLVRWALIHDVVPSLCVRLEHAADPIPEYSKRLIEEYAGAVEKHRLAVRQELLILLEQWANTGLEFLLWPVWADAAQGPGQQVPRCVELYIRERDLQRFLGVLDAGDFRRVWPAQINQNFRRTETHLLFMASQGRTILSLRWRIPSRAGAASYLEEIWRRRDLTSLENIPVFVPCPADCLLLSAMHGSENHWELLPDVLAVCDIARKLPVQEWNSVLLHAAEAGCRKNLLLALELATHLGKVNLPEDVHSEMRRARLESRRKNIVASLFVLKSGAGTFHDLQWDLRLMDSRFQQCRHLARFLFTTTAADAYADSPLGLLLRPLRLLLSVARIPVRSARQKLAPSPQSLSTFLASEFRAVDLMLEMAKVGAQDVVYDLGCGDGRIVIRAAEKYGARGMGIDLDPQRVLEASENARASAVAHLVQFRVGDLMREKIREATVVALFLPASAHLELGATLESRLRAGTRVVSHGSDTGGWEEARVANTNGFPQAVFLRRIGSGG